MTCDEVAQSEVVERYVLGQLGDDERDAFEQHYFECARCFALLRTYQDVQAELARTRHAIAAEPARRGIKAWVWLPAAAVAIMGVSVAVMLRPAREPAPASPASVQGAAPAPATGPTLQDLARFEPPRYEPGQFRGAGDAAATTFQDAMNQYQRGDFAGARVSLREASQLDPDAPHIAFFLGVSTVLAGDAAEGATSLRHAIALGDSAYLDEAHFYLAKAYVTLGRVDEAIAELDREIRLGGEHEADARAFRSQLEAFSRRSR